MNPDTIKLFKNQPKITNKHIKDLQERHLITKFVNSLGEPHFKRPGWVIGYPRLTKAISSGRVSQTDARRLLVIEIAATDGKPRQTHIDRLMVAAFAEDKSSVLSNIEKYRA